MRGPHFKERANTNTLFLRKAGVYARRIKRCCVNSYFNFPINSDQLFSRVQPVTVAGRETLTVAPEDSLLILCAHSSKHLWSRLGWICDVANLIDSHTDLQHIDSENPNPPPFFCLTAID